MNNPTLFIVLLVLGLLLGWLIGWGIDWIYWRGYWREYWRRYWLGDQVGPVTGNSKNSLIEQIRERVSDKPLSLEEQKIIDSNIHAKKQKLKKMLDADLSTPEKQITWFEDVMDRASGEYKRKAIKWAFLIGTTLAIAFNVDSIEIAKSLWREPTLRQVIVAQANNSEVQPSLEQIGKLGIPIGWSTNLPTDGQGWLLKIMGLMISGLAAAQGAPFWFDILKKLVNLRSSGPTSKAERSDKTGAS